MPTTAFDPAQHGYRFENRFENNVISEIDWRTSGLCGGMAYSCLDYFLNHLPIPNQDYQPAEGTELRQYIYNRQVDSIVQNADKWAELGFNPFGARNSEFFNWGLQGSGGGRLQELRTLIDLGKPVPLGLQMCDGGSGSHQVVAIGYDLGRYRGDLGRYQEEFKIVICDPNHPRQRMTLVPDIAAKSYHYVEAPSEKWMTYFVDRKYKQQRPPQVTASANELLLSFMTGSDDLRGGNDNLNVTVLLAGRPALPFPNVNNGKRWIDHYMQNVNLALPAGIAERDIAGVRLDVTLGGGLGGDNWNLNRLGATIRNRDGVRELYKASGNPLFRFTGSEKVREFAFRH